MVPIRGESVGGRRLSEFRQEHGHDGLVASVARNPRRGARPETWGSDAPGTEQVRTGAVPGERASPAGSTAPAPARRGIRNRNRQPGDVEPIAGRNRSDPEPECDPDVDSTGPDRINTETTKDRCQQLLEHRGGARSDGRTGVSNENVQIGCRNREYEQSRKRSSRIHRPRGQRAGGRRRQRQLHRRPPNQTAGLGG